MEFTKMKNDGHYTVKTGMFKDFTIIKATQDGECTYTVSTAKNVFEKNAKLVMEITKPNGVNLSEEDISTKLTEIIVSDALDDFYDSLPAIPTNYWFKKLLPDIVHEEFMRQAKGTGIDYHEKLETLFNTVETIKKSATPIPYEKPSVEKIK